ncbi:MAG: M48 family metallopeptidase [Noviherbaspirillum sp.]
MLVPAFYFDGKTSHRFAVSLTVQEGIAVISGDVHRQCPLADLRVSERLRNASRKVTFPDGAYLEILDNAAFNTLLRQTGHEDSMVVRMQQSWRGALIASLLTIALLALGYLYGLPAAANAIAKTLPENVAHMIGRETLAFLDSRMLAPSRLPTERQAAIVEGFKSLAPPQEGMPRYEILFRKSQIGPNALALPSGQIVLTDELIELADSDDAVMAVLSHELGHLHERHLMQRIIQGATIGAVATVLFGDASSVIANIPTVMLDLKYSRDAEREADDYAIAMMKANGISLAPMVRTFEKLGEKSGDPAPYLSSHPPTEERIEWIRKAQ